jgi:ribose transport system substrate-binding protein
MILACKQEQNNKSKLSITVIPKGTTHVFWQSIHAGAIKASKESGVDITWVGPERDDDRQQQIALVDNQVMNQVSGIVLAPIDDIAMKRPVRNAVNNGIPVVIIDSGLKDSEDIYTSFIATNNRKGGHIGGVELGKLLNGKGKVVMMREAEGAASTQKRAAGFLDAISSYPEIEVVSDEQYAGASKAKAQQLAENLLFRFQDDTGKLTIDGIFCVNESTTYGMLQALKRKRLAGTIKFVGFDSAAPMIEGLKRGQIHGLVVQNPFKMGYLGVKTMVSFLQGRQIEKLVDTGVSFVTFDNLNNPEIKELLYPDLEKWLGH